MASPLQRFFLLFPPSSIERVKGAYASVLAAYYRLAISRLLNGLTSTPRNPPVIVSLTSTPSRLARSTDIAIATLLKQRFKPDHVVLWLSDEIKPEDLPSSFGNLKKAGLDVQFRKDVGPHTKLIYALQEHQDSILISADDDVLYAPNWLGELYSSYRNAPNYIHCHRAHFMRKNATGSLLPYEQWDHTAPGIVGPSHLLFPTSGAGILIPPGTLPREVLNVEAFRRLCPTNDDVWYKAMALLGDIPCKKTKPYQRTNMTIKGSQVNALIDINSSRNDPQIRATFGAYDLYRRL